MATEMSNYWKFANVVKILIKRKTDFSFLPDEKTFSLKLAISGNY